MCKSRYQKAIAELLMFGRALKEIDATIEQNRKSNDYCSVVDETLEDSRD